MLQNAITHFDLGCVATTMDKHIEHLLEFFCRSISSCSITHFTIILGRETNTPYLRRRVHSKPSCPKHKTPFPTSYTYHHRPYSHKVKQCNHTASSPPALSLSSARHPHQSAPCSPHPFSLIWAAISRPFSACSTVRQPTWPFHLANRLVEP